MKIKQTHAFLCRGIILFLYLLKNVQDSYVSFLIHDLYVIKKNEYLSPTIFFHLKFNSKINHYNTYIL